MKWSALLLALLALGCDQFLEVSAVSGVQPGPGSPDLGGPNQTADAILGEMTRIIALADSPTDFACAQSFKAQFPEGNFLPLIYKRQGEVKMLSGPRAVSDADTLRAAFASPGANIVGSITFCGTFGVFAGCATDVWQSFVVVRLPTLRGEGAVWAHEYGHTKGLPHREVRGAVMSTGGPFETSVELNVDECIALFKPRDPMLASAVEARPEGPSGSLEELARGIHIHGMPFLIAEEFSSRDLDALESMLHDPAERAHRANLLVMLGMLGGEREDRLLADLLDRSRSGRLTWPEARELTAALLGLGYLANRNEQGQALGILQAASKQGYWSVDSPDITQALRSAALAGLAVSGRPEAWDAMNGLAEDPESPWMQATLRDALNAHAEVAANGLSAYYAGQPEQ